MSTTTHQYREPAQTSMSLLARSLYVEELIAPLRSVAECLRRVANDMEAPRRIGCAAYQQADATGIDFAGIEASMRNIAAQQGLDLEALVREASAHFHGASATPTAPTLTDQQIDLLMDDDEQALRD